MGSGRPEEKRRSGPLLPASSAVLGYVTEWSHLLLGQLCLWLLGNQDSLSVHPHYPRDRTSPVKYLPPALFSGNQPRTTGQDAPNLNGLSTSCLMICGSPIWAGLSWAVLPVSPEVTLGPWSAGRWPEVGRFKMATLIRLAVGPAPGWGSGPLRTPPLLPAAGDRLTETSVTLSLPGGTAEPAGMGPGMSQPSGGTCSPSCPCPLCSGRLQSRSPARCVVPPPCHTEDDDKTWVRKFQFPLDATAQTPGAGPAFSWSDVVSYPRFGTPRPTQTPDGWPRRHLIPLLLALRPLPPGPLEVDLCSLPSPSLLTRPSVACLVGPRHALHAATAHNNTRQGAGCLESAPESGSAVGVGGRGAWVRV